MGFKTFQDLGHFSTVRDLEHIRYRILCNHVLFPFAVQVLRGVVQELNVLHLKITSKAIYFYTFHPMPTGKHTHLQACMPRKAEQKSEKPLVAYIIVIIEPLLMHILRVSFC